MTLDWDIDFNDTAVALPLSNSPEICLIDAKDFFIVCDYKWYLNKKTGYVYRTEYYSYFCEAVYLHQVIFGSKFIDHRDGIKLNNRRHNLRQSNKSLNAANQAKSKRKLTSKYKGVCKPSGRKYYMASIKCKQKLIYLGTFITEDEAALAYNTKAKELFSEHAKLNIIC
jgi:hypothetical protein